MSIFLKKQRVYFGGFLRLLLSKLISSNSFNINTIDKDGLLSAEEIEKANDEILPLRLVIIALLLNKISKFGNKNFSSNEIGEALGLALGLAYKDTGSANNVAMELTQRQIDKFGEYFNKLMAISKKDIAEKGPYFFVAFQYPKFILGENLDLIIEKNRLKDFLLFEAAKQIYENEKKYIPKILREFIFLD